MGSVLKCLHLWQCFQMHALNERVTILSSHKCCKCFYNLATPSLSTRESLKSYCWCGIKETQESFSIVFSNQRQLPSKFSSLIDVQNSSITWYLCFTSKPSQDFSLWRQTGHINIGRLFDSSRWLLPFIEQEKYIQCCRQNKWQISWTITCEEIKHS